MNYFRALAATSSTRAATSTTPSTAAGETYRGISRRYNPGWLGWRASMRPKARSRAGNWTRNPVLAGLMEEFYRAGLEAELSALSDEELHARIAELSGVTAEEVRAWTPEECRRLEEEIRAKLSEGEVPPVIARAAPPSPPPCGDQCGDQIGLPRVPWGAEINISR